jgi:sigma-E factor negative regulatory protein RseC
MEELGIVKQVLDQKVEVEIDPSNACGNCANKSACHLDENGTKRTLVANSDLEVKTGDLVQIEVKTGNAIISAFLIFIFPILCLGCGYILGSQFGQKWGILASIIGLVVGLLVVHQLDKWIGNKKSFQPSIVKVLDQCSLPNQS